MVIKNISSSHLKKIFIGISLTGLLITTSFLLSGIIFPDGIFNDYPERPNYSWEFDYHNFTSNDTNIMGINIWFRQYNSTYLNHSSADLCGIATTRSAAYKHDWMGEYNNYSAVLNDSIWTAVTYGGVNYNEYNVSDGQTSFNTNHSDPYNFFVEDKLIAYEVDQFTSEIFSASNRSKLLYENESAYPDLNNTVNNYILTIQIDFDDFSSTSIEVHQDGWMRIIRMKCLSFGREQ